jgi:hypothetical protein
MGVTMLGNEPACSTAADPSEPEAALDKINFEVRRAIWIERDSYLHGLLS